MALAELDSNVSGTTDRNSMVKHASVAVRLIGYDDLDDTCRQLKIWLWYKDGYWAVQGKKSGRTEAGVIWNESRRLAWVSPLLR
jgi:hypothetical protein